MAKSSRVDHDYYDRRSCILELSVKRLPGGTGNSQHLHHRIFNVDEIPLYGPHLLQEAIDLVRDPSLGIWEPFESSGCHRNGPIVHPRFSPQIQKVILAWETPR